jgi:hypothetical protein
MATTETVDLSYVRRTHGREQHRVANRDVVGQVLQVKVEAF